MAGGWTWFSYHSLSSSSPSLLLSLSFAPVFLPPPVLMSHIWLFMRHLNKKLYDRVWGKYDSLRPINLRKLRFERRSCAFGGQKWRRTQNVLIANFFYQVIKENCMPYVRLLPPSKNGVLLILPYDNVYRSMCESHTYEELATQVLPYDRHSHMS